jgi:hypothetical protein
MEFEGVHGPGWHLWRGIINCPFRSVPYVTDLLISAYSRLNIFGADALAPSAPDKCFLHMLGMFAEFETNLRRER